MIYAVSERVRAAVALATAAREAKPASLHATWACHVAAGRIAGAGAGDAVWPAKRGLASLAAILGRG